MVVEVGLTVKELPLPTAVPPHEPLYHCQLAPVPKDPPVTDNVVLLPEQMVVAVADAEVGSVESEFTFTVTLWQEVMPQEPPSALTKYVVVVVGLTEIEVPLPSGVPPQETLYHCQLAPVSSEPPVSVKVAGEPGQTGSTEAFTLVGAVLPGTAVMVICAQVVVLQAPEAFT